MLRLYVLIDFALLRRTEYRRSQKRQTYYCPPYRFVSTVVSSLSKAGVVFFIDRLKETAHVPDNLKLLATSVETNTMNTPLGCGKGWAIQYTLMHIELSVDD